MLGVGLCWHYCGGIAAWVCACKQTPAPPLPCLHPVHPAPHPQTCIMALPPGSAAAAANGVTSPLSSPRGHSGPGPSVFERQEAAWQVRRLG